VDEDIRVVLGPAVVGGYSDLYGLCGDGLSCSSCNQCVGCSFNPFTCFEEDMDCLAWCGFETIQYISLNIWLMCLLERNAKKPWLFKLT
jgi:hypothetical protein